MLILPGPQTEGVVALFRSLKSRVRYLQLSIAKKFLRL